MDVRAPTGQLLGWLNISIVEVGKNGYAWWDRGIDGHTRAHWMPFKRTAEWSGLICGDVRLLGTLGPIFFPMDDDSLLNSKLAAERRGAIYLANRLKAIAKSNPRPPKENA